MIHLNYPDGSIEAGEFQSILEEPTEAPGEDSRLRSSPHTASKGRHWILTRRPTAAEIRRKVASSLIERRRKTLTLVDGLERRYEYDTSWIELSGSSLSLSYKFGWIARLDCMGSFPIYRFFFLLFSLSFSFFLLERVSLSFQLLVETRTIER